MKKILKVGLASLLSLPLFSCDKSDEKTLLRHIEGAKNTFSLFSVKELNDIAKYEDCMLFISNPGCAYCEEQRTYLNQIIRQEELLIYEIDYPHYKETYLNEEMSLTEINIYPAVKAVPTFLFFKGGKLKDAHSGPLGDNVKEFRENLAKYTEVSNLWCTNDYTTYTDSSYDVDFHHFYVMEDGEYLAPDTETLDQKIAEKELILYTWRRCSDCKAYDEKVLHPYLASNPDKKLYYYELDGYYQWKRRDDNLTIQEAGLKAWSEFSQTRKLITYNYYAEDPLGNRAGVAPTIVDYEDDQISVFRNDMDPGRNDDGTLSYRRPFYKEVRFLKSKTKVEEGDITSSTYRKALSELSSQAEEIEIKLCKEYLEEHL